MAYFGFWARLNAQCILMQLLFTDHNQLIFISIFMSISISISGSGKPYEAIFVSSKTKKTDTCDPLIVILHGGPHSVALSSFSKSQAFLASIGYSLLIVNYR